MAYALCSIISATCTVVAILAFLFGAQARLTSRFTPEYHKEQLQKTKGSQKEVYTLLGITPEQCTKLIGCINLVAVAGLASTRTRGITAGAVIIWLCTGAVARYRTGRSVLPPLAVIVVLIGVLL